MQEGYLITFEGQGASGKSELLIKVSEALKQKEYPVSVAEEFSSLPMGDYLKSLLVQDKFLRFGKSVPTAFTGALYIAADLYCQDENEIKPAIKEGKIVLKERHIDTLFACEIPKIKDDYPESGYEELYDWIKYISSNLYVPDLTFLLILPQEKRMMRIKNRGETISDEDLRIFEEREKIYRQLAEEHKKRIIVFDNDKTIKKATEEIVERIISFMNLNA